MNCDCDCHKKNAETDLKKCKESSKRKTDEINVLKRRLMVTTIAIAIGGTVLGKEAVDKIIEYFQTYDKVKQAIDGVGYDSEYKTDIPLPVYYGSSPSPGTMGVFAIALLTPIRRRR